MRTHIKTSIASNVFHDNVVHCPECGEALALQDIQMYADSVTFTKCVLLFPSPLFQSVFRHVLILLS